MDNNDTATMTNYCTLVASDIQLYMLQMNELMIIV